jgi:hypothetical protein
MFYLGNSHLTPDMEWLIFAPSDAILSGARSKKLNFGGRNYDRSTNLYKTVWQTDFKLQILRRDFILPDIFRSVFGLVGLLGVDG